jgi:hypothetical protein
MSSEDSLRERIRYLEERLAQYEAVPEMPIGDLLDGPQRKLSSDEIKSEVQRLLKVCAEKDVKAIVQEACTCRELLKALADACHRNGMTSAGQYLDYLMAPWD